MEKAFEFFGTWVKSQQDFLENWLGSQKELMDNWSEAIKKIQQSVSIMAGSPGVSQSEEFMKSLLDLYRNPLLKRGFPDFFLKVQQEGIEAAKTFWDISPLRQSLFPNVSDIFEKMIDFYRNLGFVPFTTYEELMKENKQLEKENQFLKDTINDLHQKVFAEGGKAMHELWKSSIEKHSEMSREIAKGFQDIFKQSSGK
jgi:regulator of replication initiation timing